MSENTNKYTPGPWTARPENDNPFAAWDVIAESEPNGFICQTSGNCKANARLIAAAPALLEALEAHDAYMSEHYHDGPDSRALHPTASENWKRIRAAITAATADRG